MPTGPDLVFGYGSLAGSVPGATLAKLAGHRRTWGVAMDNTQDIPGYKHYLTPDGERPAVRVAFLDLEEDPVTRVNGVCFAVSRVEDLDARERNYVRRDVSDLVKGTSGRRVWAYFGSPEARRRRREGEVVVCREYLEGVERGFRRLGNVEHRAFVDSTDLGTLPVWDLVRVDHA
ncbi:MAG: gamma-glutamylcyclotransferase [Actinomycetota bacterium]|nr:gamma-glutamylcyclotransferase [Actinomycetota bacterium]